MSEMERRVTVEGYRSRQKGRRRNPYKRPQYRNAWQAGWDLADNDLKHYETIKGCRGE